MNSQGGPVLAPRHPWEAMIAAAALLAAGLAAWVTLNADFLAHPGWLALQKADLIAGPVFVGLYWRRRRPESRFGPLLIAVGFVVGCAASPTGSSRACCLEAIQNATKHGGPAVKLSVTLRDVPQAHELAFTVADDGPGFDGAAEYSGGGVQNMHDRLAALGGRLSIVTAPGEGTVVVGVIPLLHASLVP